MSIAASTQPRRTRILRTLLLGFLTEIINKISPLITLSVAQKRLGLGSLGSALFSLSILEICVPLIVFGYTYYGALQIPRMQNDKDAQSRLVSQILLLRFGHACVTALGLFLATQWLDSWREHQAILIKLLPFIFIAAMDLTFFNFGSQRMGRLSLWTGLFKLISLAGVLLCVHGPGDADRFAFFMLAANSSVSIASFIWIVPRLGLRKVSVADCRKLLKRSLGYALVVFLYPLFERFDILVAEKTLSPEALGSYTAPWRLVMSLVPIFMVIAHTFLSENIAEKDQHGIAKGSHQALFLSLLLTVPVMVASPFVAGDILALVFEEGLRASQPLFTVFTASILAEVFVVILGMQILLLLGHLRYLAFALASGIGIGGLLAWLLHGEFLAMGPAWGALGGRLLTVLLILGKIFGIMRTLPWRDYAVIPVGSLVMALVLLMLPPQWNLFVRIGLGGFVYLATCAVLQRRKLMSLLIGNRRLPS